MDDLLQRFSDLDREVRNAERELHTFEAQLASLKDREKELYKSLGVDSLSELEGSMATLRKEAEDGLNNWKARVKAVNEVVREVESRVA